MLEMPKTKDEIMPIRPLLYITIPPSEHGHPERSEGSRKRWL